MDKLKYGCVGAGGIAEYKHLAGYSRIPRIEIASICDANLKAAQRLADKYKIPRVYSDYEEMLEREDLDLISVCTPNYLHAPVTLRALRKGIHVHCEKPIALNAKEALEMVEAKNLSGKKLMVALNNRFTNTSLFLKQYADSGEFGRIYHIKCGWRRRRGIPGMGGWFTRKSLSGGGPLIDLGVHFLDLAMFFLGYPEAEAVFGSIYSHMMALERLKQGHSEESCDVEDMAVGMVRLKNGATIDFEFSWASNIEKEYNYVEILGDKGGASFRSGELTLYAQTLGACMDITPRLSAEPKKIDEFEHFLKCIDENQEPMASPEEAARLMLIIDAVYKSAEIKREIVL